MLLICGIVALILGIIALLFSHYGRKDYLSKKKRCTSVTEGILVGFAKKETMSSDDRHVYNEIYYFPVYEYYAEGNKYEVQSTYGTKTKDENLLGQKKNIIYNPNKCEESFVSGESLKYAFNIVKIFGFIISGIGILQILAYIFLKVFM